MLRESTPRASSRHRPWSESVGAFAKADDDVAARYVALRTPKLPEEGNPGKRRTCNAPEYKRHPRGQNHERSVLHLFPLSDPARIHLAPIDEESQLSEFIHRDPRTPVACCTPGGP